MSDRTTDRSKALAKLLAVLLALTLVGAACGSDDDDDASTDDTEAPADDTADDTTDDTEAPADDAADDTTDDTEAPADDTADDTTDDTEAPADDAAGGIPVALTEWAVGVEPSLTAGSLTFDVTSDGEFPHALAIARGTSYEDLPLKDENGAVDIDALGDDFLGTTENLQPGEAATITFDLEAGDYVFFCPIENGPNSHAAAGQVLSVTVN